MVEGVAVIVLEDLLDQERIAPDIEGGFLVKLQCDIVLSGQQRSTFQVPRPLCGSFLPKIPETGGCTHP